MNSYLRTFLFAGLDNLNKVVSILVVNSIISRILNVNEFGIYNYYIFLLTFILSVTKFGLENILLLEFSKKNQSSKYLFFYNSIVLRLLVSSIFCLVMLLFYKQFNIPSKYLYFLIVPLLISSLDFSELFFLARQKNQFITLAKLGLALLSLAFRIYILIYPVENSLDILMYIYVLDIFLLFLLYAYLIKRTKLYLKIVFFRKELLGKLFHRGGLLLGAGMSIFLIMRINVFFIERYCSMHDLGIYSPAIKICELFNAFAVLLINVLTPIIVSRYDDKEIEKMLYSYLFWISILLIVPVVTFSGPILTLLFGKAYVSGSSILSITVWSLPFVAVGMLYGRMLISRSMDKLNFYRMILSAAFSVLISFLLTKNWGIVGAAYSYLLSQLFSNMLVDLLFNDIRKDFTVKLKAMLNPLVVMEGIKQLYRKGNVLRWR